MKKTIFSLAVFVTMCCLASCGGKTTSTTVTNDSVSVDTMVVDTVTVDSTAITVDSIAE